MNTKQLVVIGAGPGGYPAAFLAADSGMDVTLIDQEANPGGVCLYRGCIPSKSILHIAKVLTDTFAHVKLVVDPRLLDEHEEIAFNAGRLDTSMVLNSQDYRRIARPLLAFIAAD